MLHNMKDFLIVVDQNDCLISTIPTDCVLSNMIGSSVASFLDEREQVRYVAFIKQLDIDQLVLNVKIAININQTSYLCYFNGYKEQNTYYITVLFFYDTEEEVLKRIMKLNSEQVNELRVLYKNMNLQDSKAYEEISKLNSELLNSRRVIEKQNAELQKFNALLKKMSIEDALTGCHNRRQFYLMMRERIFASQSEVESTLVMIDFNHFKQVNDQFGHDAGDRLLIDFVQIAKETLGDTGEVYRLGGDEFILYLKTMNKEEATQLMVTLNQLFSKNSPLVSLAYGIVTFRHCDLNYDHDLTSLIRKADELMYLHKKISKSKIMM